MRVSFTENKFKIKIMSASAFQFTSQVKTTKLFCLGNALKKIIKHNNLIRTA